MNIIFSLVAHAAIITTAFMVGRGWTSPAPADPLTVSLVSGLSEIKVLDGQDQKKQAIHNSSPTQYAAVNSPHDYGEVVMDKIPPETGGEKRQISTAGEDNPEEKNPSESQGTKIGPPGPLHTQGLPMASLSAGYQGLPAGIAASGDPGRPEQVKTQSKGINTEDGKAIRKAIEKALIYPLFARKRGLEGTALTEFTVNTKGYPEDIRLIGSSGHPVLDSAAKESLIKAAPFAVGKGRYEMPIRFRLKNN